MRSWSKWKIFSRKWKSSSSGRSARADLQRVLIVGNRAALGRRQDSLFARRDLMQFAAFAAVELLIMDRRRPCRMARFDFVVFAMVGSLWTELRNP